VQQEYLSEYWEVHSSVFEFFSNTTLRHRIFFSDVSIEHSAAFFNGVYELNSHERESISFFRNTSKYLPSDVKARITRTEPLRALNLHRAVR
jgi:hypothetical protein